MDLTQQVAGIVGQQGQGLFFYRQRPLGEQESRTRGKFVHVLGPDFQHRHRLGEQGQIDVTSKLLCHQRREAGVVGLEGHAAEDAADDHPQQRVGRVVRRGHVVDAVLGDLYGDQRALTSGVLPPELVFGYPGYIRAVRGVSNPGPHQLFMLGCDLSRGADGRFLVNADWTQAPSGAGYALADRRVDMALLPASAIDPRKGLALLPPLIKGYLRLGAQVLGAPAWDPDFNTADLPMLMRIGDLPARYRKHFLGR